MKKEKLANEENSTYLNIAENKIKSDQSSIDDLNLTYPRKKSSSFR